MKRLIAAMILMCLLLCACGAPAEPATEPPVTEPATQPTTEATDPPTEPPTEAPKIRHPLNGSVLDAPYTGRAIAVVTPNNSQAMPQYGISKADILYEVEAEGSVTRCMMIFSDLSGVETVGPIRSIRTYFNSIAVSYDIPVVHCGGSNFGRNGCYDINGNKIDNWEHIDEMYNSSYFFRDYGRYNSGYSWEYCLFTTGEKLSSAMATKEYNKVTEEGTDYALVFDETPSASTGSSAQTVTVKFHSGKTTTMAYDAQSGKYFSSQHGGKHIDGANGQQLSFRNVIIIQADQTSSSMYGDSQIRKFYDLLEKEGTGYYACDGKIIPIKWSRENLRDHFTYTTEDGQPLVLGEGKTYVAVTSKSAQHTWQ